MTVERHTHCKTFPSPKTKQMVFKKRKGGGVIAKDGQDLHLPHASCRSKACDNHLIKFRMAPVKEFPPSLVDYFTSHWVSIHLALKCMGVHKVVDS